MRTLASIQQIQSVEKHPNADALDICSVLGWSVITKRGEFSVGDFCVYCEIDSVLPDNGKFEFLRSKKFRIKTMKMRGVISQGICFPISILGDTVDTSSLTIGTDVTDIMGIVKYEIPDDITFGNAKGNFPLSLLKTDEIRIQSLLKTYYTRQLGVLGNEWIAFEKLDGSSMTIYIQDGVFGVCSRNLELKREDGGAFWECAIDEDLENKLRLLSGGEDICVQGELVGNGIQKNKYGLAGRKFYAFRMYKPWTHKFYRTTDMISLLQDVGINCCPVIAKYDGTQPILHEETGIFKSIENIVEYSIKKSMLNPNIWQEGIVFVKNVEGNRYSFKVINPEFLIKFDC